MSDANQNIVEEGHIEYGYILQDKQRHYFCGELKFGDKVTFARIYDDIKVAEAIQQNLSDEHNIQTELRLVKMTVI